jgi:hypothetical protein
MGGGRREDGVRTPKVAVDMPEALQEARHRAGADGEVASDLDITEPQFAGDGADAFMGVRVLDEEQVFGQGLAEAAVGFADAVGGDGAPLEPTFVDPFLDGDMGARASSWRSRLRASWL